MKKVSIIGLTTVLFFSFALSVTAQNLEIKENKGIVKKNAIRLNWFPQLSYDRLLWQKGNHHVGATVGALILYRNQSFAAGMIEKRFWNSLSSLGVYHLYGKRNHYFETSFQYSLIHNQFYTGSLAYGKYTNSSYQGGISGLDLHGNVEIWEKIKNKEEFLINNMREINNFEHWATARIGYRYQRSEGGFLFRAGFGFFNRVTENSFGIKSQIDWGLADSRYSNNANIWLLNLDMSLGWSF